MRDPGADSQHRILVIDDEPDVLRSVVRVLERARYATTAVASCREAFAAVSSDAGPAPDVVLTDLHLADGSGIEIVVATAARHPTTPTIVMTGRGTIGSAVDAMRRGAFDYLVKPFEENDVLLTSVARALAHKQLVERNRYLEQRLVASDRYEDLVGGSSGMRAVVAIADTVAPTDVTVLILGESGTGKELLVRAIHRRSRRRERPFMAINCGALAESVLESELFGHAKGAFTGAVTARRGLFEEASGGTVFLDEVGELPPSVQVRLLRVLQEREVRAVGSNTSHPVDVRVVAATNRDLEKDVSAGRFRQDLYYRLNVVSIDVPPLRARMTDVPLLAHHFVRKHASRHGRPVETIDAAALAALCAYDWPGNVRELENTIERAVVLCKGQSVAIEDLPSVVKLTRPPEAPIRAYDLPFAEAKREFERNYIQHVVLHTHGAADAARVAGLDRSNFRRLLRRFDIDVDRLRQRDKDVEGSD
ncbi:MAG TPA: sigma-54 dependent transcriptional regulator [Polyangiaceae bacterium]|nr:sigma-54 dependent transcriptional regulator [Polyangiaceae bacterium]